MSIPVQFEEGQRAFIEVPIRQGGTPGGFMPANGDLRLEAICPNETVWWHHDRFIINTHQGSRHAVRRDPAS